jgi:carnitine-CoA ligase
MSTSIGGARVLGEWLRAEAEADPERPFVQCGSPWLTLRDLDEQSDRLAAGLQRLGLGKGDRLAILLPNRIEYIVLVYASAKAGVVQVPLNAYLRGEFLRHQLAQSAAAAVVTDGPGLDQVAPLLPGLPELEHLVLVGEPGHSHPDRAVVDFSDLAATPGQPEPVELSPPDLCVIMYTSGTTGASKGCMISHGYYTHIPRTFIEAGWFDRDDVIFGATPLFHFTGQVTLVEMALAAGGSAVVEPAFSASTFMARAAETGATALFGVGAMALAIMARPPTGRDKDHCIRQASWIPMTEDAQQAFHDRFGVRVISEVYGQSECWPGTLGVVGQRRKIPSLGRPFGGMQVRLVDAGGNEVPVGEVGEIVVRPDQPDTMFQGYWRQPEATVEAFRNLWHHTGDNGRFDEDGFLYFVDRKKDSLRRRGSNVSSIELEQAVMKHPDVVQAAAHAVPSELSEDDIKVCIVLAPGVEPQIEVVFDFFKKTLPYFAVPRYVEFVDSLPVTPSGRVQKFLLRQNGVNAATLDLEKLGLSVGKSERRT